MSSWSWSNLLILSEEFHQFLIKTSPVYLTEEKYLHVWILSPEGCTVVLSRPQTSAFLLKIQLAVNTEVCKGCILIINYFLSSFMVQYASFAPFFCHPDVRFSTLASRVPLPGGAACGWVQHSADTKAQEEQEHDASSCSEFGFLLCILLYFLFIFCVLFYLTMGNLLGS